MSGILPAKCLAASGGCLHLVGSWPVQVLIPHRKDVKIEHVEVSRDFLTVFQRIDGLQVRGSGGCMPQACLSKSLLASKTAVGPAEGLHRK